MKNVWLGILKVIMWVAVAALLVFSIVAGSASFYTLGHALLAVVLWGILGGRRKREKDLVRQLEEYGVNWDASEKMLVKSFLAQEVYARTSESRILVAGKTLSLRILYTGLFVVGYFGLSYFLYYRQLVGWLITAWVVVYALMMNSADTLSVLYRKAKQESETDFSVLVKENTYNETEHPWRRKLTVAGALVFLVAFAGIWSMHTQAQWQFAPMDGGYGVAAYRPAMFAEALVSVPQTHNGQPVVAIGEKAFADQDGLYKVCLPESVVSIGEKAFQSCENLITVELGSRVEVIGACAFKDCKSLFRITLPDSLTTLLGESFMNCSALMEMAIPQGVTEIRGNTFEGCTKLRTVTLHDGIVDIHASAFRECRSLREIRLPNFITEIHANTFENCVSLQAVDIPNGVTRIAAHAFRGCSALKIADIPLTVKEIRSSAFRNCGKLKEVTLAGDTVVDERAFKESPTKIYRASISSDQWNTIVQEAMNKTVDVYYYVTDAAGRITWKTNGVVQLCDDPGYARLLAEGQCLQPLSSYSEVAAFLEQAKENGITTVEFLALSATGTKLLGEDYFVSYSTDLEGILATCYQEENKNG